MTQEAYQGINSFIMLRRLSEEGTASAVKIALQTTHTLTVSRDTDSQATKDGNIVTDAPAETELEVENIGSDDELNDLLWESAEKGTKVEVWEVQKNRTKVIDDKKHYFMKYMQGSVNEMEADNDADDSVTGDATFSIDGTPKWGWGTLPEAIEEAMDYAFRGIEAITDSDKTGGGIGFDEEATPSEPEVPEA